MSKKTTKPKPDSERPAPAANAPLVPNPTLSRTARTGEETEDELLLERKRLIKPEPRIAAQAEFTTQDPWRVLRIMGEYVHGFDALAEVGAAITIFGSARTAP